MKIGIEGAFWTAEYYEATVVSVVDYYPFGSAMAGRKYNQGSYRYGFNGMEKDDEVKGEGNSYDFGARIFDSRVGRWLSLDPLAKDYPSLSDYNFVANSPMMLIDVDGRWFVKFDNPDNPTKLVFYAEDGDDLSTLEIQLGLKAGTLTNHESFKSMKITNETTLDTELNVVETVKQINSFIASKGQSEKSNCGDFCAWANGKGTGSRFLSPSWFKNNDKFKSVTEGETSIGDVITYSFSLSFLTKEYLHDVRNSEASSMPFFDKNEPNGYYSLTKSEQTKIIDLVKNGEEYNWENLMQSLKYIQFMNTSEKHKEAVNTFLSNQPQFDGLQHVSIVLLKSKDGSQIQQIIEKSGKVPIDIQKYPSRKGVKENNNLPMYEEAVGEGKETQYLSSEEE